MSPTQNPAETVRHLLSRSAGQPLDPLVRSFFEDRFGHEFNHVRLHTGAPAAAAAAALQARAFTFGQNIVFAAGEHRPGTPSGRWLLAHELAHVVQQEQSRVPGLPNRLGQPDEPSEAEADAAADAILAGRDVPALSPDRSRTLRRAVQINASTATIDAAASLVDPSLSFKTVAEEDWAIVNLTNNFNLNKELTDWAFKLTGHVKAAAGGTTDFNNSTVGFIQYLRHNFLGFFYAGRQRRDGSIVVQLHPEIGTNYLLDCGPNSTAPFMMPRKTHEEFRDGELRAVTGDHPLMSVKQKELNVNAGCDNFLFHIVDDREACAIFSFRNAQGKFQHLAHIKWSLRYDFKFKWRKERPLAVSQSTFRMGPSVIGAPKDPAIQAAMALLGTQQTEFANDRAQRAMKTEVVPRSANRRDNLEWFSNVPPDFWS